MTYDLDRGIRFTTKQRLGYLRDDVTWLLDLVDRYREALDQIVLWDRERGHDGRHARPCMACQRIDLIQRSLSEKRAQP